jgi:putative phosphoesterase
MRIAVISDTHMPSRGRILPPRCAAQLAAADLILHAGDHSDLESLQALRALGPEVVAVHGNVDSPELQRLLPEQIQIVVRGVAIAMVHDAGSARGRGTRLRARFPDADVVIFGHSHISVNDTLDGTLIVNPGSPTDRRRQPAHTMAELDVAADRTVQARILAVDDAP